MTTLQKWELDQINLVVFWKAAISVRIDLETRMLQPCLLFNQIFKPRYHFNKVYF